MTILDFFIQYRCTEEECDTLLNHLCSIRVHKVIKDIQKLKQIYGNRDF